MGVTKFRQNMQDVDEYGRSLNRMRLSVFLGGTILAQMIPEYFRSGTRGETILFNTLKGLPDDYVVYREPIIRNRRPDFVIIGPDIGFVVLEVKDYSKSTLLAANQDEWVLQINGNIVKHISPLSQARKYAQEISNVLKKDSQLVVQEGPYQGNLRFPYGYGVVFTKLTQRDLVETGLYNIIPPELVLARDEVDPENEAYSEEHLLNKIQNMFPIRFPIREALTENDLKLIRYILFPEIRISAKQEEKPVIYEEQVLFSLRDVKVMDLYQENLAKALGDKHRLLRGVAGSGKTLVLACRAKYLAQCQPGWKILVLCYNISLATFIRQIIKDIDIETKDEIEVDNFHNWSYKNWGLRDDALIDEILQQIESGLIESKKYDAILIDEGQDFEPSWLKLVYHSLNPNTNSLLLVEDRAQQIYHRKSLSKEIGLSFQGRSKILNINYRNTLEIIVFAWDFYQHFSKGVKPALKDGAMEIIPPRSANRHGPLPVIKRFKNFVTEAKYIGEEIIRLHDDEGIGYEDIAILYRVKQFDTAYVDTLQKILRSKKIPHYWLAENNWSKRNFRRKEDGVKLSTVESAKGLEFKVVFICNVDNFPFTLVDDLQREVSLMYIALTRAVDYLYLTYSGNSLFTEYLDGLT